MGREIKGGGSAFTGEMNSRASLAGGDTPDERGPLASARARVLAHVRGALQRRLGVGREGWRLGRARGKKGE